MRVGALIVGLLLLAGVGQVVDAPPAEADNTGLVEWQLFDGDHRDARGYAAVGFQFWDADIDDRVLTWSVRVSSTSDPAGITVPATRPLGVGGYFTGTVSVTSSPSSDDHDRIKVADGDALTVTYDDPSDGSFRPKALRDTITWWASSRAPDTRELLLVTTSGSGTVVRGARGSAAPGATVRVHPDSGMTTVLASARADTEGRVTIQLPYKPESVDGLPASVWLSAVESGLSSSGPVELRWSAVTGRIVTPDGKPVRTAMVGVRKAGTKWACDGIPNCSEGPGLSNIDGRWGIGPEADAITGAGDYDIKVEHQGVSPDATWSSGAYGNPPPQRISLDEDVTTDVGDIVLLAPNVIGRVLDANGWPVPLAEISRVDADGESLAGGGYSRADGRFGLRLADGSHRIRIRTANTCVGGDDRFVSISVSGGTATPSRFTVRAGGEDRGDAVVVDLSSGLSSLEAEIGSPVGEVTIDLEDVDGAGALTTACPDGSLEGAATTLATPGVELDTGGAEFDTADVCVQYSNEQLWDSGLKESELELLHFPDIGGVDVTTTSHDAAANEICGTATSFSPFAVGYRKKATVLTLSASDNEIRAGETVTLRGKLTRKSNGAALAGKRVILQRKPVGTSDWTRVKSAQTNEFGRVRFSVSPRRDMVFRLRFKGTIRLRPSADRTVIWVR